MDEHIELQERQYLEAEQKDEIHEFLNTSTIVATAKVETVDIDVPF